MQLFVHTKFARNGLFALFLLLWGMAGTLWGSGGGKGDVPEPLRARETAVPFDWEDRLLILCYHDIPVVAERDPFAVETRRFVEHLEFLKSEGHHFVSFDQVRAFVEEGAELPAKPVLLTFDDGFKSYGEHVVPILEAYGYPSVLAVVTSWTDDPEKAAESYGENMPELHSWEELRELGEHPLVEIAGHSHDLHRAVQANPFGSTGPRITTYQYLPDEEHYWTPEEHAEVILSDLRTNHQRLEEKAGVDPSVIVWPFGAYNLPAVELAEQAGFSHGFSLDEGFYEEGREGRMPRVMIHSNMSLKDFAQAYRQGFEHSRQQRVLHADLDYIYDSNPEVFRANVDRFIERVYAIYPTAVYLQAFADPDGDGNVSSVYFANDLLPVRADVFGFVSRAIQIRGIEVYAWMPMLSFEFPDKAFNRRNRVRSRVDGEIGLSDSWYRRLSPFSPEAGERIGRLYAQLARHADVNGILFQDDGYLAADEDYHPAAIAAAREWIDVDLLQESLSPEEEQKWQALKTRQLNKFGRFLAERIKRYRPDALDARTLYAPAVTHPESEAWLSQNFAETLSYHDQAVVLAYPRMEKADKPAEWLRWLVREASRTDENLERTIFKTQTVDWDASGGEKNLSTDTVMEWMEILLLTGAKNVGYYPDNFHDNHPRIREIRTIMSARIFPYLP